MSENDLNNFEYNLWKKCNFPKGWAEIQTKAKVRNKQHSYRNVAVATLILISHALKCKRDSL